MRQRFKRRYWIMRITGWWDEQRGSSRLSGDLVFNRENRLFADYEGRGDPANLEEVREGAQLALTYKTDSAEYRYALLAAARNERWLVPEAKGLVLDHVELRAGPFDTWEAFETAARASKKP